MDPPSRENNAPRQRNPESGYPSPSRDHPAENPKFVDDLGRLNIAFRQSLPEAVRRAVRDNWEKCLMGSEFHQAFIVSAT